MVELFANSGDSDQMTRSVASNLGMHCFPVTRLEVSSLQWVKKEWMLFIGEEKYILNNFCGL